MNSLFVPGQIAQMRGKLTTARYHYATVFVDNFSDIDYVHLHQKNDAQSVIEGKLAFERFASTFVVTRIHHYHCDNGIFADTEFRAACKVTGQTIKFCGVNAHYQNGVAEKRIRDLRDSARSMLLLARHNRPGAITADLWGFALHYASVIRRSTVREGEKRSPVQKFAGTEDISVLSDFHTFGCPTYNFDPKLQQGQSQGSKWDDRSRVGIYLGPSREHSSNVLLVLLPDRNLVSPQFHVKHDDRFETTTYPLLKNIGRWQGVTQIHKPTKEMESGGKGAKRRRLNPPIDLNLTVS